MLLHQTKTSRPNRVQNSFEPWLDSGHMSYNISSKTLFPNPARRTMLRIGLTSALGPGVHFRFADFPAADAGSTPVEHDDPAVAARLRAPQYHPLRYAKTTFAHQRLLCCRKLCNTPALHD